MADRSHTFAYKSIGESLKSGTGAEKLDFGRRVKNFIFSNTLKTQLVLNVAGFLLGRAVILDYISPFGLAYLTACIMQEINISVIAVSIFLGVLSAASKQLIIKYVFASLIFILLFAISCRMKLNNNIIAASIVALSNFISGYFVIYIYNYYLYDLMMIIIESCLMFISVLIYCKALPMIKNYKGRRTISSEEIVSISILASLCFVGAELTLGGISAKNMLVILFIMLFSHYGSMSAGATVGIVLGVIQALSGSILPGAIGVYGLCGIMCGSFKKLGRIGCPAAFILGNALMTFYINGSTEVLIRFYDILAASAVFMLIPKRALEKIMSYNLPFAAKFNKNVISKRHQQYTVERLKEVSGVFEELAATLKSSVKKGEYFSHDDAAKILDKVVNKTCMGCGMHSSCWKRDFYKSYQHLFNILSSIENGADTNKKKIIESLKGRCMKPEDMYVNIKYFYDLYKSNIIWKKKINESRMVVSEQLKEVANVVSNLAYRIDMDVDFNREVEEIILVGLENANIYPEDVIAVQSGGSIEIELKVKTCGGRRDCIRNIIPAVNKAIGKKFVKSDMMCVAKENGICSIKLKEASRFQVATGIARAFKSSGGVSGDNYSFIELKDGKFMLALSDGMGSGPKAAVESNTTITLLEKLLYAGFDRDVALKTINSMLLLKSDEDSYATIDMTVINTYNGEVEFVKVGAVSTFIKYEDRVDIIRTSSLPVGILNNLDMEFIRRKLKDGDFVIMITDGILDANEKEINKEKYFAELISEINTRNPQTMADTILRKSLELTGGKAIDDMTVMVAKIWETI